MAVSARWFINRFRSMSAGELALRARRAAAARVERARVVRGWSPGADAALTATRPLFAGQSAACIAEAWQESFRVHLPEACRLLDGGVTLFSREYRVGRIPTWSRDPETGVLAPACYGKSIDYRDGRVVGNIKVLWELGRHQYLVPMAVRYLVTGDRAWLDAVVDHVDSWVETNPFVMGVHWCSAMEVALRAISWSVVHSLVSLRDGDGGLLAASRDRAALTASLFDHGHFIRHQLSRHSSANNHLMGELVGLWCLARVFDFGPPSRGWAERARREIEREAELQVHPDGVVREQAVHYQVEILEYLLLAWSVGAATGAPLGKPVRRSIEAMNAFLHALRAPGGSLPRIGDSDDGLVLRFDPGPSEDPAAQVTEAVAQVLDHTPGRARSEKAFWYARMAGTTVDAAAAPAAVVNGSRSRAAAAGPAGRPLRIFDRGGYAVVQDAGLHLVFDAGPLGYLSIAAHGHADALAFCAAWHGRWWLVDPGTFAYQENPEYRRYFRGTAAHNTVTVDRQDQSRQTGPFMWDWHARSTLHGSGEADGVLWLEGSHDGYRRLGVGHRRRIECPRGTGGFRVVDRFEARGGRHDVELNFHFHPRVTLELGAGRCRAWRADAVAPLQVTLDPGCRWQIRRGCEDPIRGWYSPSFGDKAPCWTLTGTRSLAGEATTVVAFEPGRDRGTVVG